jgi:hypothetical protein
VSTISPRTFHVDNLATIVLHTKEGKRQISNTQQIFLCAVLNSFVADYLIRQRVTNNLNFFYLYQLPVPRLSEEDGTFSSIVERASRLICTTDEFDDLAKEIGLKNHRTGIIDATGRAQLRAELDGLIAHLYGLTEEEFVHILSTFPLVPDPVKVAAHNAYRDVERGLIIHPVPARLKWQVTTSIVTSSEG